MRGPRGVRAGAMVLAAAVAVAVAGCRGPRHEVDPVDLSDPPARTAPVKAPEGSGEPIVEPEELPEIPRSQPVAVMEFIITDTPECPPGATPKGNCTYP